LEVMMLVSIKSKQKGFTLIEIMIALMLGLIIIGATLNIYISTIKASSDTIKSIRLNYDLDSVMQLMVNDIRRAGYWGGASVDSITASNPPTCNQGNPFLCDTAAIQTNLRIPNSSCIRYTYDFDGDSLLDFDADNDGVTDLTDDENEFFGFKLENGAIKIRSAKIADNTADCSGSGWETITSVDTTNITYLEFSLAPIPARAAITNSHPLLPILSSTSRCLNNTSGDITDAPACTAPTSGDVLAQKRSVNIHISGYINGDTSVLKSLSTTVQIKNSPIYFAP